MIYLKAIWAAAKLIPLRSYLWGFLIVSLVSYHFIDRSRAVGRALEKQKVEVVTENLKAQIEYRDRWIDTEGMLSYLAATQRKEAFVLQQSILNRAVKSKKEYRDALPTFPATSCVIDALRLRQFNQIVSSPRQPETP